MRMTDMHVKTLKESPFEGEMRGHNFMFRAGLLKKSTVGNYAFMPYGVLTVNRLMSKIGLQFEGVHSHQVAIIPEYYGVSKRKTCQETDEFVPFMTPEILKVYRSDIASYKDLPKTFFQNLYKGREIYKVNQGLYKSKNYLAAESYVFMKETGEVVEYLEEIKDKTSDLLTELEIEFIEIDGGGAYIYTGQLDEVLKDDLVQLETAEDKSKKKKKGKIKVKPTQYEGMARSLFVYEEAGDEKAHFCDHCGYGAIDHIAAAEVEVVESGESLMMEEVYTPDIKTIEQLETFLGIEAGKLLKTLVLEAYFADGKKTVVVCLRGDRELNLHKVARALNISIDNLRLAEDEEVIHELGTFTGFAGPVDLKDAFIVVDDEIPGIKNMVTGANKRDYHLKNVNFNEDYTCDLIADVKYIDHGADCPHCGAAMGERRGFTVATFEEYGNVLGIVGDIKFKDDQMKEQYVYIGRVELDIYRILAAMMEQNSDDRGLVLPKQGAPFNAQVIVVNTKKEEQMALGEKIYRQLGASGLNVLLDDRNERAGAKFADADLMGIPVRIVVGKMAADGLVEFKIRAEEEKEEMMYDTAIERAIMFK